MRKILFIAVCSAIVCACGRNTQSPPIDLSGYSIYDKDSSEVSITLHAIIDTTMPKDRLIQIAGYERNRRGFEGKFVQFFHLYGTGGAAYASVVYPKDCSACSDVDQYGDHLNYQQIRKPFEKPLTLPASIKRELVVAAYYDNMADAHGLIVSEPRDDTRAKMIMVIDGQLNEIHSLRKRRTGEYKIEEDGWGSIKAGKDLVEILYENGQVSEIYKSVPLL